MNNVYKNVYSVIINVEPLALYFFTVKWNIRIKLVSVHV